MRTLAAFLCAAMLASTAAFAVEPDEMLKDPVLEARAREISKGLRCVVCQNQTIDDSHARLARDLRLLVRKRLRAGDSDKEVVAYIVGRYGDFVLLRPPFKPVTYLLWFGPALVFLFGAVAAYRFLRGRTVAAMEAEPLSEEERSRLDDLVERRSDQ